MGQERWSRAELCASPGLGYAGTAGQPPEPVMSAGKGVWGVQEQRSTTTAMAQSIGQEWLHGRDVGSTTTEGCREGLAQCSRDPRFI